MIKKKLIKKKKHHGGEREAGQRTAHSCQGWEGLGEKTGIWGKLQLLPRALHTAELGRDASAEPTQYTDDPRTLGPGAMNRGQFLRKG